MMRHKLKELGEAGWIIGPEETEEGFARRVNIQTSLSQNNLESIDRNTEIMNFIKQELRVEPWWIQVRYSSHGLKLWEGAASWITEQGTWIQLRKSFKKGHFLGYRQDEVILHEILHSLRFTFEEPRFEEIIAHAFTKKRWRRFFGPLFTTPTQAYIFLMTLLLTPFAPVIPCTYLLWRLGCLIQSQRLFKKAVQKVRILYPHISPYSVIIRLTDDEIQFFAKQNIKTIQDYIQAQRGNLRWQQLHANLDFERGLG